jgi:cold shock CspA family protein
MTGRCAVLRLSHFTIHSFLPAERHSASTPFVLVTMAEKIKGCVKWFSNRNGYGFITPTSDNAPTTDDIFVHQSSIVNKEGEYRTLVSGKGCGVFTRMELR